MSECNEKDSSNVAGIYGDGSYYQNNPTWDVEDAPWKARQIGAILSRNNLRPRSICEIGCGAGEIVSQLSGAMPGTSFLGFDVSPQAIELCQSRVAENVAFRLGDMLSEDVFFDCALCIDVLEHVEDYMGFARSLRSKATYKVFHIPLEVSVSSILRDAMMQARARVGHLHYFTPATALATLRDCGYEIVDHFYTTPFRDIPGRTVRERIARVPRSLLYALSPDVNIKVLGGCSLLVLGR